MNLNNLPIVVTVNPKKKKCLYCEFYDYDSLKVAGHMASKH